MVTETQDVIKVIQRVQQEAKLRAKRATERYGTLSIGDWHAQGDVMFKRIEKVPEGSELVKNPKSQLAPGNTRGSRHIVMDEHMAHLKFYTIPKKTPLDGPVVEADAQWEVTHPDHGHVIMPKGIYQIRYQRQYAKVLKRVRD